MKRIQKMPIGAKASFVYMTAILFSRGLAIITMPIFTRLMPTEEIGVVTLYNSWVSMISVIATLSLTSGGFQLAMKEYRNERDLYESSVLTITTLMAIILSIIYFVAPNYWQECLGLSSKLIMLMLFGFLVMPAYEFWMARQRYEYKYKWVGVVAISSGFFASLLSVVAVLYAHKMGYENSGEFRLFANFAVIYGISGALFIYIFVKGKVLFHKEYWLFSLKLSLPLIGYGISTQILNVSDRVMINTMISKSAVGIYGTLYTVSSLSLVVWSAINSSMIPFLYDNIEQEANHAKIRKLSASLLFAYAGIAIIMTFLSPEIVRVLTTEEYYEAIYLMPPVASGIFLTSLSNMYSNILVYYKKTQFIMVAAIIAATVNIVLNYFGIQKYGYMAAAYTTLIAYILLALIEGIFVNRVYMQVTGKDRLTFYNNRLIIILSVSTIFACMSCMIFYRYNIIRLSIVGLLVFLAIFKRREILFMARNIHR